MRTTRDIIAAIGPERFEQMLDIGRKSVSRAEATNSFTARWRRAIDDELKAHDNPGISEKEMDLFNYKERIAAPSS